MEEWFFISKNPPCNAINLVAREIRTNQLKWHEESSPSLKIKVTSGYFCGKEFLCYVATTKINHKFDFQFFSTFVVSKGGTTTLSDMEKLEASFTFDG